MAATVKGISKYELRSMEIYYLPVKDRQLGITHSYISQLRINDPNMGVLLDNTFMPVAERTVICEKITSWLINNLFSDINKFRNREVGAEWFSVYIPVRVLVKDDFLEELKNTANTMNIKLKDLCLCFNNKILYEDHTVITNIFKQMKENGIKTMIMDFGDDFCPITRISSIMPDYVLLSQSVTDSLLSSKEEKKITAISLYNFLKSINVEAITSSIKDDEMAEILPESFNLCTGTYAGNYRKPRSVR